VPVTRGGSGRSIAYNACIAYNFGRLYGSALVASLTIRNLEEALKGRLRVRAASRGRSMEEEARHILRAALNETQPPAAGLGERIRRRFLALGDVQLPTAAREPVRELPFASDVSSGQAPRAAKATGSATARRRR
jgi:plasmid stability protein